MKLKTILHGVTAIFSALVFAFFALPFYSTTMTVAEGYESYLPNFGLTSGTTKVNGYDFIIDSLKSTESSSTGAFAVIMALITLIVAGLAFVMAVVALLNDFEVIKNEKVEKVIDCAFFAVVVVFALVCILNLVGNVVLFNNDVLSNVEEANSVLALYSIDGSMTASAGWALSILTLVCGLGAVATTSYAKFKKEN